MSIPPVDSSLQNFIEREYRLNVKEEQIPDAYLSIFQRWKASLQQERATPIEFKLHDASQQVRDCILRNGLKKEGAWPEGIRPSDR